MTVVAIARKKLVLSKESAHELSFVPVNRFLVAGDVAKLSLILIFLCVLGGAVWQLFSPKRNTFVGCLGFILLPAWTWLFVGGVQGIVDDNFVIRIFKLENGVVKMIDTTLSGRPKRTELLHPETAFIYSETDRRSLCTLWRHQATKRNIVQSGLTHQDAERAMTLLNKLMEQASPLSAHEAAS